MALLFVGENGKGRVLYLPNTKMQRLPLDCFLQRTWYPAHFLNAIIKVLINKEKK